MVTRTDPLENALKATTASRTEESAANAEEVAGMPTLAYVTQHNSKTPAIPVMVDLATRTVIPIPVEDK